MEEEEEERGEGGGGESRGRRKRRRRVRDVILSIFFSVQSSLFWQLHIILFVMMLMVSLFTYIASITYH